MDTVGLISLIYLLIGSTLGIASAIKMVHDYRKEQMKWDSTHIESSFERKDDGNILIKLEFMLTNQGRRAMSIPIAFLRTSHDPQLFRFGVGDMYKPQDFEPINLAGGETKPVTLNFVSLHPPSIEDIKELGEKELPLQGINAELELVDNEHHRAKAQLFIYEGGFIQFFEKHRIKIPVNSELFQIIMARGRKEFLQYP